MSFEADSPPTARWRPSLGRLMLGVGIVALFLTEDSRIILLVLTYVFYTIAFVSLVISKRHRRLASERPAPWRLAEFAMLAVIVGWAVLGSALRVDQNFPRIAAILNVMAFAIVFIPVILVALVTWLLIPLPRMERRRA